MKKLFLTLAMLFALGTNAVMAAGVGYVDYAKVSTTYPLAKKYIANLDKKTEDLKKYIEAQQAKIKKAKTDAERTQISKESSTQIAAKRKDYLAARSAYDKELETKIVAAAEKIRVQKKLDIIISKDVRVTGGVDCTQDILNALK